MHIGPCHNLGRFLAIGDVLAASVAPLRGWPAFRRQLSAAPWQSGADDEPSGVAGVILIVAGPRYFPSLGLADGRGDSDTPPLDTAVRFSDGARPHAQLSRLLGVKLDSLDQLNHVCRVRFKNADKPSISNRRQWKIYAFVVIQRSQVFLID